MIPIHLPGLTFLPLRQRIVPVPETTSLNPIPTPLTTNSAPNQGQATNNDARGSSSDTKKRWNPAKLVLFRLAFTYFMLYALCCGNATIWESIPHFGLFVEGLFAAPFHHAALWAGRHLFHLQGVAAQLHSSGFNDRALDWVAAAVMLALALATTTLWTALDRTSTNHSTLLLWLRFTLRLTLAVGMLIYGCMKLIPIQVAPPSLAVLNEPVGQISPLTLLWTTLGYNPLYEQLAGCIEIAAGVLLLYRRTALAGTLLTAVVMANVVLFDCFFDVPVKLYAINLLAMCAVAMAADIQALFRFFWLNQPATLTTPWAPQIRTRNGRFALLAVELLVVVMNCITLPLYDIQRFAPEAASLKHPSPLTGQWHIDTSLPTPFITGNGQPLTDIFLEPAGRVTGRDAVGELWGGTRYDEANHTLTIYTPLRRKVTYTLQQPDPTHLILEPSADAAGQPEMRLTRVPLPTHYALFERGFHWVNEWGYEH